MFKWVHTAGTLLLLGGVGVIGYQLATTYLTVDIYRDRLAGLSHDYAQLRDQYNRAVRRTAVTELIVEDGRLAVAIRTADGRDRRIQTDFNPNREIYCDYVLIDGRLWIRRIYDDRTPPREGVVIDPQFADVDWTDPAARYGNAVYRSLGEGRWIVTVTGDGSLGLSQIDEQTEAPLSPPPEVRDYEQIEREIDRQAEAIGPADVLRQILGAPRE